MFGFFKGRDNNKPIDHDPIIIGRMTAIEMLLLKVAQQLPPDERTQLVEKIKEALGNIGSLPAPSFLEHQQIYKDSFSSVFIGFVQNMEKFEAKLQRNIKPEDMDR
jgi:hypothetical protein